MGKKRIKEGLNPLVKIGLGVGSVGLAVAAGVYAVDQTFNLGIFGRDGCKIGEELGDEHACFRAEMKHFSWKDLKDEEKLRQTIEKIAQKYMEVFGSNLTIENLTDDQNLILCPTTQEYITKVKQLNPDWGFPEGNYAYTGNDEKRTVVIDMQQFAGFEQLDDKPAGVLLLQSLWHEWSGHKDLVLNVVGNWLNNPNFYFMSPNSGQNEEWTGYMGAEVETRTYYGFAGLNEVLTDTILMRILRGMGFLDKDFVIAESGYYPCGTEYMTPLSENVWPDVNDMVRLRGNSDFEGLIFGIGGLGGEAKGFQIAGALHQGDCNTLDALGLRPMGQP